MYNGLIGAVEMVAVTGNDGWTDGDCSGTGSVALRKVGSGTFTLTNTHSYTGTTGVLEGTVIINGVITVNELFNLFVPTAFTPNGDGINDVFRVSGQPVTGFHMVIFDRWGMKVFDAFDLQTPWIGDAGSGYYAPNDVYKWVVEFDSLDRRTKLKGHVALVR